MFQNSLRTEAEEPLVAVTAFGCPVLATVTGQGTYPQCVVEAATPALDARPSKRTLNQDGGTGSLRMCTPGC